MDGREAIPTGAGPLSLVWPGRPHSPWPPFAFHPRAQNKEPRRHGACWTLLAFIGYTYALLRNGADAMGLIPEEFKQRFGRRRITFFELWLMIVTISLALWWLAVRTIYLIVV